MAIRDPMWWPTTYVLQPQEILPALKRWKCIQNTFNSTFHASQNSVFSFEAKSVAFEHSQDNRLGNEGMAIYWDKSRREVFGGRFCLVLWRQKKLDGLKRKSSLANHPEHL